MNIIDISEGLHMQICEENVMKELVKDNTITSDQTYASLSKFQKEMYVIAAEALR